MSRTNRAYAGEHFSAEVKNIIRLSLSFAKAVGERTDRDANLVISPYNALACLSMAAKAAKGQTREEMARALYGVGASKLDAEVDRYKALNDFILAANKDQVTIKTANGAWVNSDMMALNKKFAGELKKSFGAEISSEKFTQATVDKINRWADNNTNGLIKKVLDSLNPTDPLVLASALYFKGPWTDKFDKALTKDRTYTTDDGVTHKTPTMQRVLEDEILYQKGNDYEAISLTFGKQDYDKGLTPTMRLVLVRPEDLNVPARDWLAAQASGKVPAWLDNYAYEGAKGKIEMPHMDIEESYGLNEPLRDLGIKRAFQRGGADFSGLTRGKNDFNVGSVKHDVVFKADEEGAEAAAVTTMVFECAMAPSEPVRIDFKLNRSYVLVLQDIKTGAPLFIGAVNTPNKKMSPAPVICPKP